MAAPPRIFISATSGDLRTARAAVKDSLLTIGCHPVERTTFGPDYRSVRRMLDAKIRECQALIHIVGLRYGAEPDPASLPPGTPRRSFTQLEYDIGRALAKTRGDKRFRVYTFVCSDGFPYDSAAAAESPEKGVLQEAHRQAILTGDVVYETGATIDALKTRVLALKEEALQLRVEHDRSRWMTAGVGTLVLLALIGIGWGVQQIQRTETGQSQQLTDIQKTLQVIADRTVQPIPGGESLTPEQRFERALVEVAEQKGTTVAALRTAIDAFVVEVKANPQADFFDRALADFAARQFASAATNAERGAQQARERRQHHQAEAAAETAKERTAWKLAGDAYAVDARYEDALAAYRNAAGLVDRERDPLAWADAHIWVSHILHVLARYAEAEPLLRDLVTIREAGLPPNDPEIATALNNLAGLLQDTNRQAEAEPLFRRALVIREESYGPNHPAVANSLNNLAAVLRATNRLAEAEPLHRRALAIREESYGPNHPEVANSLNNVASLAEPVRGPTPRDDLPPDPAGRAIDATVQSQQANQKSQERIGRLGWAAPSAWRRLFQRGGDP